MKDKEFTVIFFKVSGEFRVTIGAETRADAGKRAKEVFGRLKRPKWQQTEVKILHRIEEQEAA